MNVKKHIFSIGIGLLIMALLYIIGCIDYFLDGGPSYDIERKLNSAGAKQQQAADDVAAAAKGIDQAAGTIGGAVKRADEITAGIGQLQEQLAAGEELFEDSARRIRQCLNILEEAAGPGKEN